jgi:deoxyribose-phosphate aldolase
MYLETPDAAGDGLLTAAELRSQGMALFSEASVLAGVLDHTLLRADALDAQVRVLAEEAARCGFACAMVNPAWVPLAHGVLAGTVVRVGTVLGFPLGASLPQTKVAEARHAARAGALDLDMVLNIGALRSGLLDAVGEEIRLVGEAAHGEGAILKVILETCLLNDEQKRTAARLCVAAGADFVKTSTGFSTGGATVADVALLRAEVGDGCGVKASGGIRNLADAVRMTEAGANRIGASASVAILNSYLALIGNP